MLPFFLLLTLTFTPSWASPPPRGAPLTVQPCSSTSEAQRLTFSPSTGTVRAPSSSLCVTLPDAPFPAPLTLQPCAAGARSQAIVRRGSAFEMTTAAGACVAWATATDAPVISSHTCDSTAWNSLFTPSPSGVAIWANYTAPGAGAEPGSACVTAAPPAPPPVCPAPSCTDDVDCNLNGVCGAGGACTCYPPWGGVTCGELRFLPIAAPSNTNGYPGPRTPNETTWGGNAVFFDGLYHLFVAEMVNNCSLNSYLSNSRCAHATSPTPEGPYTRVDVAVDVWCHNPQVSYVPGGGFGGADLWALWHLGNGTGGNPRKCAANGDVIVAAGGDGGGGGGNASGAPLHVANSPFGPWYPVDEPLPSCNNPTQWQHKNGTWFLICESYVMYMAPNVTGPWQFMRSIARGGTPGIYEDGFLFIDPRGNWHQFFHTYTLNDTDPTSISGHSFSADGIKWHPSCVQPYFNTANVTDGSVVRMSTRERPKLLFNAAGEPTHLFNGVCPTANCYPKPAVQCKLIGYWDHTLVVPLDLSPPV